MSEPIPLRNEEAGYVEFANEDVPYFVREIDGSVAILFDAKTRNVIGYRVYDRAPSPSPAPGVVEALQIAHRALIGIAHTFVEDSHGGTKTLDAHEYQKMARDALASISQPAKGEREAMFRVFLKSKDDDTAFTFSTKAEMDAFLKVHRAASNGWDITDIHEYQCSTAASALDALSKIEESAA